MTINRMLELLEIEHECMLRKSHDDCDGQCDSCDLVQDDGELHEMHANVIMVLKSREPVKPLVGHNIGPTWWYACPVCRIAVDPGDKYCRKCGRTFRWE